jgi:hypothetical protein
MLPYMPLGEWIDHVRSIMPQVQNEAPLDHILVIGPAVSVGLILFLRQLSISSIRQLP